MPGIFDSIGSFVGNMFGGGGGGGVGDLTAGLDSWMGNYNAAPFDFSGAVSGGLSDMTSGLNSFLGNYNAAPFDLSGLTSLGSDFLQTAGGGGPTPANIQTNVPGLMNTPGYLGSIAPLLGGGGGINLPGAVKAVGQVQGLLGGGGGGGGGAQPQTRPATGQGGVPTAGTPGGTGGVAPGGGLGGLLGGITGGGGGFGNILSAAGLLGGLLKGDQLPPQASQLQTMADQYGQMGQQQMQLAQANQQGNINDQALGRVNRSLQQRESSIRKSYADMGMSGSTMEAADLNDARSAADQEVFSVGQQMATSGLQTALSMFGDQSGIMQNLMQAQIDQDKALSDAMAEFAAAAVRYDGTQAQAPAGSGGTGGGLPPGLTSNPISPASLTGLVPLGSDFLQSILGPSTTPATLTPNVPGLVNTPDLLSQIAPQLDTTANPDYAAAYNFLNDFQGLQ